MNPPIVELVTSPRIQSTISTTAIVYSISAIFSFGLRRRHGVKPTPPSGVVTGCGAVQRWCARPVLANPCAIPGWAAVERMR